MWDLFFKSKTFYWSGRDVTGLFVQGEIQATSPSLAKALLSRRGIHLLNLRPKEFFPYFRKRPLRLETRAQVMRQLATMVKAHVPILQVFSILQQELNQDLKTRGILATLQGDLEKGLSLSEAFRRHPHHFDPLLCSLIHVGEATGTLDTILETIATLQEKQLALRDKIRKALFYPTLILILSSLIGVAAFVIIVPRFEELFTNVGAELPGITRLVLKLSQMLTHNGWLMVLAFALFPFFLRWMRRSSKRWVWWIDSLLLNLPVGGSLIQKNIIARFTRTLALTLQAGIPITEGIELMRGTLRNQRYEQMLVPLQKGLTEGNKFHDVLDSLALFPPMTVQMVAVGEESGQLEEMLNKVADIYEEQMIRGVEKLTESIEPAVLMIIGMIVGTLVIALYLPVFQLGRVITP